MSTHTDTPSTLEPMDLLSDELIQHIFLFLSFPDRVKCASVCRRFNMLARAMSKCTDTDTHVFITHPFYTTRFDRFEAIDRGLAAWGEHLQHVVIDVKNMPPSWFRSALKKLPRVHTLRLYNVTSSFVSDVANLRNQLKSLTLEPVYAARKVFDPYPSEPLDLGLLTSCVELTEFRYLDAYGNFPRPRNFKDVLELPSLRKVWMHRIPTVANINFSTALTELGVCDRCYALSPLPLLSSLSGNVSRLPEDMSSFPLTKLVGEARGDLNVLLTVTNLRTLSLKIKKDVSLTPLSHCVHLEHVSLSVIGMFTLREVQRHSVGASVAALGSCINLKSLHLSGFRRLHDPGMLGYCTNLISLNIESTHHRNMDFCAHLVNLRELRFGDAKNSIYDAVCLRNCTNLTLVVFKGMQRRRIIPFWAPSHTYGMCGRRVPVANRRFWCTLPRGGTVITNGCVQRLGGWEGKL